ncbi:MAG: hypothetical protein QOK05_2704 [Chloroflexota bacterium]|jgi:Flp pilus assembly protein TadG|nr:hypothetical protein [Chloroflexota bacterium]
MPGLTSKRRQRGQTLPIFALASLFIVGVVALAVDFGFLTNQHRNLQAFADEAATAGALKLGLNPGKAERTAARDAALIYLRENLGLGSSPSTSAVAAACIPSPPVATDLTSNVGTASAASCQLGTTTYKVSIWSPAEPTGLGPSAPLSQTVSVRISESVTTALAGLFSFSRVPVGAFSVAQAGTAQPNYALYSDGCINVLSSKTEVIAGDVYINQCTLSPGSGAFCTYGQGPNSPTNPRLGASAGDATYGPYSTLPITLIPLQTKAGCTSAAVFIGKEFATGNIIHSGLEEPPPTFGPPPLVPTCAPGTCAPATTSSAACLNGSKDSSGATATDCFSPGAYTTIGPINNNLNPGVYHIYGDPASSCTRSQATTNCAAVYFAGNTFNANWPDVANRCWKAPNVPSSGTFSGLCPDGFIDNPTFGITDPQCAPGCPVAVLSPPTFALAASIVGGNLDPVGTGTLYYFKVTAYNSFGDSLSNELAVNVISPTNTGKVTITITGASPGATGYHVWGPSLTPGGELFSTTFNGSVNVGSIPVGSALFPLFDTSGCPGFCNMPGDLRGGSQQGQYGVTFVLEGKASVCVGHTTGNPPVCESDSPHPTVLLAPYCNSGFTAVNGIYQCTNTAVSTNDGTFTFYGPSEGVVWAGTDSGTPGAFGLTGVIDLPRAKLKVDTTKFHLVPGQAIFHHLDLNSSNTLDPLIYWGHPPQTLIQVRIIR